MNSSDERQSLTPELIQQLLDSDARAEMSAAYVRLMEIYCVVKAGGTTVQTQVVQRLEAAERSTLLAEIKALAGQPETVSREQALRQEIQELERSVADRLAYLQSINPHEEAIVQKCIPMIDQYFASLDQAHG